MNSKNIKRHLKAKLRDWLKSIDDEYIRSVISENTIITGGAMVSLLTGEPVNDYDVYFRTKDACLSVAQYYVAKWNQNHPDKPVQVRFTEATGRIDCFVSSKGIATEDETQESLVWYNFDSEDTGAETDDSAQAGSEAENSKDKYRPRFITSNAITLTDKIQLVCRFYGEVEEIHKNYDFAHQKSVRSLLLYRGMLPFCCRKWFRSVKTAIFTGFFRVLRLFRAGMPDACCHFRNVIIFS